jgi:hypothetical protein
MKMLEELLAMIRVVIFAANILEALRAGQPVVDKVSEHLSSTAPPARRPARPASAKTYV